ncbi:hypothetical protein QTP88_019235 [Uroleucon formosanum]
MVDLYDSLKVEKWHNIERMPYGVSRRSVCTRFWAGAPEPILWDPTDPQYKMGKKKLDFWTEISKELKLDVNEVKKKMDSLLASFRRERKREANSRRSGAGTDEIYHSKWFAFEEMKFLNDKFKPRITKDTIDVSNFFYLYLIGPRL